MNRNKWCGTNATENNAIYSLGTQQRSGEKKKNK